MTVEELANKRYGGEFVFMFGHLEGRMPRHGMTFEKALEQLKLGRKIKRIDWGKKYICMFIVESDVNILMVDTGQKVASNWNPTEHDIMSNDWEIAG